MLRMFTLLLVLPAATANLRPQLFQVSSNSDKEWRNARDACRAQQEELFIVRNQEDNQMILSAEGWIGLRRMSSSDKWQVATGEEAIYTSFESNPDKNCAYKEADKLEWKTEDCSGAKQYICTKKDEVVVVVQERKTWEEAVEHCRSLVTSFDDYDLVSLLTADDRDYAREKAQDAATDQVWTGLRFLAGRWFWVDGETSEFPPDDCVDDNFCGALDKNGQDQFRAMDCQEKRNFLCGRRG